MTTPEETKQARFKADTHRELMRLAAEKGGTADDALRHLLGLSTVRVEVTDEQRARWTREAEAVGVPLEEFIRLRIEACLTFGTDGSNLQAIFAGVDALCRHAGLRPVVVDQRSTRKPRPSTRNRQEP